ncbi:ABC transporter sub-family G-like protein 4 [Sarcoptes scabiei]|uniref:ABC transporter sub-family G-like protein 4 n=1 Tax=Sarcoptes scabiei TaxID=52283 RepID=A0A131ZW83_SARSC|nr:ABC transporter sub-family G-like protein 4 [Sarcoptes scabiei]
MRDIIDDNVDDVDDDDDDRISSIDEKDISLAWHNIQDDLEINFFNELNLKSFWWKNRGSIPTPSNSNRKLTPSMRRLNGYFKRKSINAILGPSDRTRYILIKTLLGQQDISLCLDAKIFTNKNPCLGACWIRDDLHKSQFIRMSTIEMFRYNFFLKNSITKWFSFKKHFDHIVKELSLDNSHLCSKRFDQFSLKEKRLINIGLQLMSIKFPIFIFIDEPFRNLSNNDCDSILKTLKHLAIQYKQTIVISSKSLSDYLSRQLDHLYVIAHGGVCIFAGPPAKLSNIFENETESIDRNVTTIDEIIKISHQEFTEIRVRNLANRTQLFQHEFLEKNSDKLVAQTKPLLMRKHFRFLDVLIVSWRLIRIFLLQKSSIFLSLIILIYYILLKSILFDRKIIDLDECFDLSRKRFTHYNQTCSKIFNNLIVIDSYCIFQTSFLWLIVSIAIYKSATYFFESLKIFHYEFENQLYDFKSFMLSSIIKELIESILWSSFNTILIYQIEEHLDDDFDIERLIHYFVLIFLLFNYYFSYGLLIGSILHDEKRSKISLLLLSQSIVLLSQILNNNRGILVDRIFFNFLKILIENLIAIQPIYDALLFTYFGINRCGYPNFERYSPIAFQRYLIEPDRIYRNLFAPIIILLLIRLIVWFIVFIRFKSLNFSQSDSTDCRLIAIDYGSEEGNRKKVRVRIIPPILNGERDMKFYVGKILFAWRSLSLIEDNNRYHFRFGNRKFNTTINNSDGQILVSSLNAVIGGSSTRNRNDFLRALLGKLSNRLGVQTKFFRSRFIPIKMVLISNQLQYSITNLTVKQNLIYSSVMKNVGKENEYRIDHEENALNLIDELDLVHVSNREIKHCCPDELKRLEFAMEMTSVMKPNLVAMIEPTRDFDIYIAENFVRIVSDFSKRHTIAWIVSFETCSARLLSFFDQIMCLGEGGVFLYAGPPSQSILRTYLKIQEESASDLFEELLRRSCLTDTNCSDTQELLVQDDSDRLTGNDLNAETVSIPNGLNPHDPNFSALALQCICTRNIERWKSSYWFIWSIYLLVYLACGFLLNLLFRPEIRSVDSCISFEYFNETMICPLHRYGSKNIWAEDGRLLADNYLFLRLSNYLFLMIVMIQTCLDFSSDFLMFLGHHQNAWFSTGVFFISHKIVFQLASMIPIIVAFQFITNHDYLDYSRSFIKQIPVTYLTSIFLMMLATESIQNISNSVTIIFANFKQNSNRSTILIQLSIYALLTITSFARFENDHFWLYLNVIYHLNKINVIQYYGHQRKRCPNDFVSIIFHQIGVTDQFDQFNRNLTILIGQTIFYHILCWLILLIKMNGYKLFAYHHLSWMDCRATTTTTTTTTINSIDSRSNSNTETDIYI